MAAAINPQGSNASSLMQNVLGIQQARENRALRTDQNRRAEQSHEMQMQQFRRTQQLQQSEVDQARQAQLHSSLGKMMNWADTPEKWAEGISYLAAQGHSDASQFAEAFGNRDMLRALYSMPQDQARKAESTVGKIVNDMQNGLIDQTTATAAINRTLGIGEGETYRPVTDIERETYGLGSDPYQISGSGKISPIGGRGQTINVGGQLSKPPTGFAYQTGEDGIPIRGENGAPILVPMEGSEQARDLAEVEEKEALRNEAQAEGADLVLDTIGRIRGMLDGDSFVNPAVGFGSGIGEYFRGSNANNYNQLAATIESNIAFGALQKMREASPTGGALGAVSERELMLLQSTVASLSSAQSESQVREQLNVIERTYSEIMRKAMAYDNAEQFGFSRQRTQRGPVPGQESDDDFLSRMLGGN